MRERFAALGRSASDLIFELDAALRFIYVSPNSLKTLQHDPGRMLGQSMLCFVHPDDLRGVGEQLKALSTGCISGGLLFRCRDGRGEWRWLESSATAYRAWNGESHTVFISRDETQRQQLEERRRLLASRDATTLLYNKHYFVERLVETTALMKREAIGALIYVDLDNFKVINDCCGHLAGDRLIVQIANLLYESAPSDGLLARLGGDEFLLLLKQVSGVDEAATVAERIRSRLAGHRFIEGGTIYTVHASLGVAEIKSGNSSRELLTRANAASASAKAQGGNRVEVYGAKK